MRMQWLPGPSPKRAWGRGYCTPYQSSMAEVEVADVYEDTTQYNHRPVRWYKHWIFATVMLCCYGFFKEFKPSEPFLTPYLTSDLKNFTKHEVNSKVYPFWTYSYLISVLFVFLLTDLVRYKPVILLESVAYLTTRVLLVWGTTIVSMQWMQVAYGVATATEIAYYSYVYAVVSIDHFKKVTSYVRAIRLLGQAMAGIVGQILISANLTGYLELNYISFTSVCVACIFAIFLPNTFDCDWCCSKSPAPASRHLLAREDMSICMSLMRLFWRAVVKRCRDFIKFYCNPSLLKWSIWWALATCGVLQVGNYVQSLWKEVGGPSTNTHLYNGVVESLATLCSAGAAFILSFLKVNWPVWGEVTISVLSLLDSAVLLFASQATALWGVYICHILYRTTYAFLITIATTQLALNVTHESYAFIFGFNTFIALLLQSILTLVVADERGLDLGIRAQFVVYGGYYYVLTLIFLGAGVYKLTHTGWIQSFKVCWRETVPKKNEEYVEDDDLDDPNATIQNKDIEEDDESLVKPI